MKRVAAIDIGTNSTRLLVAEGTGGVIKRIETGLTTTRLGEGIAGGLLLREAMERTVQAVRVFKQTALNLGVEKVVAAATSAVRDASNQSEFMELVEKRAGLQLRVLSGEEEAALSYRGVLAGLVAPPHSTVVLDIGGGSTELTWQQSGGLRLVSVNAGAVRMTETGVGEEEISELLRPALEEIKSLSLKNLVGVGGTVTTLAAIDQRLAVYDPERVHGYCLSAGSVERILNMLKDMDIKERKKVPGMQPERADIIVAGIFILKTVLNGLDLSWMYVSECDMLYGLLLEEVEIK